MVTLTESVNIPASYEKLESWILNFLDNRYLTEILTEGKYPDRILVEELLRVLQR